MALHEQSVGATDEWFTPPHVFAALGCEFDLDVASPGQELTPWIPAKRFMTCHGLTAPWSGFVWMNPPFGPRNGTVPWLERFFAHGNGIALVPDRTSAPWWQLYAPRAELVLFVSPKIKFIDANGAPGSSPAQGTSLLAVGQQGCAALQRAATNGLGVLMAPRMSFRRIDRPKDGVIAIPVAWQGETI
jgi:DNA N-6-adenine-methyltransferase (Dam)